MSAPPVRLYGLTRVDLLIGACVTVVLVAAAFVYVAPDSGAVFVAALFLFAPLSVLLSLIDLRTRRLPDRLVIPGIAGLVLLLILDGVLRSDTGLIVRGLLGSGVPFVLFWLIAVAKPGSIGGGDVKFVALTGGVSAWAGFDVALVALFVAFLAGGIAAMVVLIMNTTGEKRTIPFGPFLALGAWSGVLISA